MTDRTPGIIAGSISAAGVMEPAIITGRKTVTADARRRLALPAENYLG